MSSRVEGEVAWIRCAGGTVAPPTGPVPDQTGWNEWPPPEAEAITVDGIYRDFAEDGFGYGPAFQGLRGLWRRGNEVFAEVTLPDEVDADRFGLHPALLDSALHAISAIGVTSGAVPFAWSGVRLNAAGVRSLRVRLTPTGTDAVSLTATDANGASVLEVRDLALRPVSAGQLSLPVEHDLYELDWFEHELEPVEPAGDWAALGPGHPYPDLAALVAALDTGTAAPDVLVVRMPGSATPKAQEAHADTVAALELLQAGAPISVWTAPG